MLAVVGLAARLSYAADADSDSPGKVAAMLALASGMLRAENVRPGSVADSVTSYRGTTDGSDCPNTRSAVSAGGNENRRSATNYPNTPATILAKPPA